MGGRKGMHAFPPPHITRRQFPTSLSQFDLSAIRRDTGGQEVRDMTSDTEAAPGALDTVYRMEKKEDVRALYADWAAGYDADLAAKGYASPDRCAAALAQFAPDRAAPILDLGCGTGLSGAALKAAGFDTIDGTDFSPEMLAAATAKTLYRNLTLGDLEHPIPAKKGEYSLISAIGVFSPGHAPAQLMEDAIALLPRGGLFVFTLNEHAMAEPEYGFKLRELTDGGWARVLFKERGPHLPGIGLEAEVWVLERAVE